MVIILWDVVDTVPGPTFHFSGLVFNTLTLVLQFKGHGEEQKGPFGFGLCSFTPPCLVPFSGRVNLIPQCRVRLFTAPPRLWRLITSLFILLAWCRFRTHLLFPPPWQTRLPPFSVGWHLESYIWYLSSGSFTFFASLFFWVKAQLALIGPSSITSRL